MQKTCTKRKIEYIESNTVELGSRNGFLFTNWLGRCKSKCCLILYGSCHVQGNALFMDYSISQKANVWPHVISVLSSFDERCIVYSFFPPLSCVCVFFVDATEKMETSFFPASVCMSHFLRWIHVWTNHRAMWECVVSAFVCAFECSYLICINGCLASLLFRYSPYMHILRTRDRWLCTKWIDVSEVCVCVWLSQRQIFQTKREIHSCTVVYGMRSNKYINKQQQQNNVSERANELAS